MRQVIFKHGILLLLLSIFWAGTFIFVKIADENIDPYTIMAIRGIISSIFLMAALTLCRISFLRYITQFRYQVLSLASGILIAYMWLTIAFSEKVISAAMASLLLTALVPITWVIAIIVTREKQFFWLNFIGIVIATLGILIVIGYQNIFHADHKLWASLLYISGLVSFALAATINKKYMPEVSPLITITYNIVYMAIILTVIALSFGHPSASNYSLQSILALVALGLLSTGVGYLLYFYLSHHAGLVYAALSTYFVPIFGFIMGVLLLSEKIQSSQLLGLVIVLGGVVLVQKPPK